MLRVNTNDIVNEEKILETIIISGVRLPSFQSRGAGAWMSVNYGAVTATQRS